MSETSPTVELPEATPCVWCPTLVRGTEHAAGTLRVGGKVVGRLCPACSAEAHALEAEARAEAMDYGDGHRWAS